MIGNPRLIRAVERARLQRLLMGEAAIANHIVSRRKWASFPNSLPGT